MGRHKLEIHALSLQWSAFAMNEPDLIQNDPLLELLRQCLSLPNIDEFDCIRTTFDVDDAPFRILPALFPLLEVT